MLVRSLVLPSLLVPLALTVGCAAEGAGDSTDSTRQAKIIGTNDMVVVKENGANIPAKYGRLLDAFGRMSMGCTGTHIGNGLVLSAGHCFGAPSHRTDNVACPDVTIEWGYRVDAAPYMTSHCEIIRTEELSHDRDYSIFRVSPVPPVAVDVDLARPAMETALTIFGHPRRRPLEWSQTCVVKEASLGGWGAGQFSHQCDTEPGNSGSTILDDGSLKVVGIHDGGITPWNYGTFLTDTPIAEVLAGALPERTPRLVAKPHEEG